jgi:hypothetical protein
MAFGEDFAKWLIVGPPRSGRKNGEPDGWMACPPWRDKDGNKLQPQPRGRAFTTGAEALAAFAAGRPHTYYVCDGQHDDGGWSCSYCAGGLQLCTVCGRGEGDLAEHCPGVRDAA